MSSKWQKYFFKLTDVVASNSSCLKRQVGCVLVKDKRIIATGYNGVPSGFRHCESACWQPKRKSGSKLDELPCIHAEENALLQCAQNGIDTDGATAFVSITPCNRCLLKLYQAGIRKVYCKDWYKLDEKGEELRLYILEEGKRVNNFSVILAGKV